MKISNTQALGLDLLKKDRNIPIDQRCEGGCMYCVNMGLCGSDCPRLLDGECEIEEDIIEEQKNV